MNKKICFNLCLMGIVIANLLVCCCLTNAMENNQDQFAENLRGRRVAFAMALHPRLGQQSSAKVLPRYLVQDILKLEEIGKWKVKLQEEQDEALRNAVIQGLITRVEILLAAGANVNAASNNKYTKGYTPLHFAAEHEQKAIVHILLNAGAKVDAVDNYGYTPLHCAVEKSLEGVLILLDAGANVDAVSIYGEAPLHVAIVGQDIPCVQLLLPRISDLSLTALNLEKIGVNMVPRREKRLKELIIQEAHRRKNVNILS